MDLEKRVRQLERERLPFLMQLPLVLFCAAFWYFVALLGVWWFTGEPPIKAWR